MVSVLYIDNVAELDLVKKIKTRIDHIDIDGINDIGELKQFLCHDNKNVFPLD